MREYSLAQLSVRKVIVRQNDRKSRDAFVVSVLNFMNEDTFSMKMPTVTHAETAYTLDGHACLINTTPKPIMCFKEDGGNDIIKRKRWLSLCESDRVLGIQPHASPAMPRE